MLDKLSNRISKLDFFNKIAVADMDNSHSLTYERLFYYVSKISMELEDYGVKERSHVVLIGNNTINFIVSYIALLETKATVIPITPDTSDLELKKIINQCDANFVLNTSMNNTYLNDNRNTKLLQALHSELIVVTAEPIAKGNYESSVFMRTSGSTSEPKIVVHSIDSLLGNAIAHGRGVGYTNEEVSLVILPLPYSFAHTSQMLSIMLYGGTLYLSNPGSYFSAKKFIDTINKFNITSTCLLSIHLLKWSQKIHTLETTPNYLKHVCYAGGPTPFSTINKLGKHYPTIDFLQAYGLTEAGPRVTVVSPKDIVNNKHHVGKTVEDVKVQIRESNSNNVLETNEMGEIYIKSPYVMRGYYKNESLTKEVLVNGWLTTGDIGYLCKSGYLHINGRSKNVIITMGNNIYPEEIEEHLLEHPLISDAYVYGVNDDISGEIIGVDVVLKESLLNENDIVSYCRQGLAHYKVPRFINFTNSIKRNNRGKIIRHGGVL